MGRYGELIRKSMSNHLICKKCGNNKFDVNGWKVTEDTLERDDIDGVYDEDDVGKIEIVEVICSQCGEQHKPTQNTKL